MANELTSCLPLPGISARALACVWMAKLFLSSGRVGMTLLFSEAAPNYQYHSYHANRHHQQYRGQPRQTSRFGLSPPGIDIMKDDDEPSTSYFERNDINPPPLVSRRRRVQAEPVENEEPPSELDSIIDDAKRGEDANARLRYDLLWRHDGKFDKYFYDRRSYPWEYAWHNQTDKRGVPVEMNINFHRVFSVDIVNSVMDLVVWFRLVWVDPRLTWDPEEYGGLDKTWFWIGDGGAGGETSEIWTPDIELWNMDAGLKGSLEDTYARVSYDGTVWWGRPGHLRPTCKFIGLSSFPFDRLTCTMEFGSWMLSGKYLRIEKFQGTGFTIGGSLTAGESYEEYSFAKENPISSEKHIYSSHGYATESDDEWPVLLYNVTVTRSWQPYARGYIATQTILNFVGFSAFWLPPSCGERMSLSITSMLAALASEIVVAAYLPAAAEMTWFSKFSILSMVFAFVSLVESVSVLYFYYKRSEDLVPVWYSFAKNWYVVRKAKQRGKEVKKRSTEMVTKTTEFLTETTNNAVDAVQNTTDSLAIAWTNSKDSLTSCAKEAAKVRGAVLENGSEHGSNDSFLDNSDPKDTHIRAEVTSLVEDTNPGKSADEMLAMYAGREEDLVKYLTNLKAQQEKDHQYGSLGSSTISQTEKASNIAKVTFSDTQIDSPGGSRHLPRRSVLLRDFKDKYGNSVTTAIGYIPKTADDFQNEQEVENNMKWKHVAARIDDVARFWIPTAFVVSLAIVFTEVYQ